VKRTHVIWTREALNDLETIYEFLAQQSYPAAQRIIEELLQRAKQLELLPESGVKQEFIKGKSKEYRYLVAGNYKVVYTFNKQQSVAYVVTVFDTRLNPEKLSV
jgi:addiction module RelE/StbE family toxin